MKKIYYLLSFLSFFLISLSSEGSGRIDLGFGLTAFATTKITGSEIAILAMQNNKLSTGNFKNKNAVQLFVKYDKDFLDFLGARAGLSYKMIRKRADPKYTYNSDDGNFDIDITAFVFDMDVKFKFATSFYLGLGFNFPLMYSIDDKGNQKEEGSLGFQGSFGYVANKKWGFELFYSQLKGKLVYENTAVTKEKAYFSTPLLGFSAYYALSL